MIRRIKNLSTKLQGAPLIQLERLAQRSIQSHKAWPDQCIPSEVSSLVCGLQFERIDVPIPVGPSQYRIVRKTRFQVWTLVHGETRRVEIARAVESKAHREWMSGS